jgi:hypothetical protein
MPTHSFAALDLYLENLAMATQAPPPPNDEWLDVAPGKPNSGKPSGGGKAALAKKKKDAKPVNRATNALKKVRLAALV